MGLGIFSVSYLGKPSGRENLEPGDTATGITSTLRHPTSGAFKGRDARGALIQNKAQNEAQFTIDGTDPTASAGTDVGFVLGHDDSFTLSTKDEVINFKCIDRVSGSRCKLEVLVFF